MTTRMTTTDTITLLNEIAGYSKTSNPENANRLLEIANESTEKSVAKAAKKALYLLGERGILPSVELPKAKISAVAPRIHTPIKGWASNFDGAGNQTVSLLIPGSEGEFPTLVIVLINVEIGIKDWITQRAGKNELNSLLEKRKKMMTEGIVHAEIDPDYAHWLVHQANAFSLQKRVPTPAGFNEFMSKTGDPEGEYSESLAYSVIPPTILDTHGDIPYHPKDLFKMSYFKGWYFDVNDVYKWVVQWVWVDNGASKLSESVKQARKQVILEKAVDSLFDKTTRVSITRRLEDTAYILWKCEQREDAIQALFFAISLKQSLPARKIPFALEIVNRTIEMAVIMMGTSSAYLEL